MMGFSPRTTAMIEQRNETFRMNPAFTKTAHWHAGATNSQFCRGGVPIERPQLFSINEWSVIVLVVIRCWLRLTLHLLVSASPVLRAPQTNCSY
jgi:hypothetical protein